MFTSQGKGQYSTHDSSGAHTFGYARRYKADGTKRLVVWCHSAGGGGSEPWIASNNTLSMLEAIQTLGLPVISADFSGVGWGNDASQTALTDAITFAGSTFNPKTDKVILLGVSMGGLLALNWARANPTKVAGVGVMYPCVALQAMHDGTGGATAAAASIETAYTNLAGFNAAVASHDPSQNETAIGALGVPLKMWYSTADTVVGTSNQTAFASGVGSALATQSVGAAAHADMTQVSVSQLQTFVASIP